MPRNEDGEFELILGNKQLLSVFFIVVTLLAVFFAMGFIMGRSVNPVTEAHKVDNGPSDKPIVVDAKPSATNGMTASVRPVEIKSPTPAEITKPEPKPEAPAKPPEPPAKKTEPEPKPEPKKAEAKKETKAEKAERVAEAKAEAKKETKKPVAAASGDAKPGSGTYLQVSAVGKAESELVSEVLNKKGFRTAVEHVVKDGKDLYRVLVGPVKPGADQSKNMDELKAAGFKPFPKKF